MNLDPEIRDFIVNLTTNTAANTLSWRREKKGFVLDVGTNNISIMRDEERSPNPTWTFSVTDQYGREIWETVIRSGESDHEVLDRLYEVARKSTLGKIFSDVNLLGQAAVLPSPSDMTAPPPLPPSPAPRQIANFFRMIAGRWDVDYSLGKERAKISPNGDYYVEAEPKYQGMPKFKLVLIACDAQLLKVEIAKDFLDGRRHSIEVLKVDQDSMEGFDAGSKRKLKYVRIGSRYEQPLELWHAIIDAEAEYVQQYGHHAHVLKLPVLQAYDLAKLRRSEFGALSGRVMREGIKVFEEEGLLGVPVQLIPGGGEFRFE